MISFDEIDALMNNGAEIETLPKEISSSSLESALRVISDTIAAKKSHDVTNAIEKMVEVLSNKKMDMDMCPLIEAMDRHTEAIINRPSYQFSVTRNSKGQMIGITANPQTNSRN